jgi:glycerol dehydrogenase
VLHGEKVAFSTIYQLELDNYSKSELCEVLEFALSVGLPVCLEDLGVKELSDEELTAVATKTCIPEESIHSMPFPVTIDQVKSAIIAADVIGKKYRNQF